MFTTIKRLFESPKTKNERNSKELLRENLSLIPIDLVYIDDPILNVPDDKKTIYYKKFHDIIIDKDITDRINYLINKQAKLTLQASRDGTSDALGYGCINGISSVKDDFVKLGNSYLKETVAKTEFDKYKII